MELKSAWRGFALGGLACAALLAGCGGGGTGTAVPVAEIKTVKVMGDSLADVGTFGFKFTIQPNPVIPAEYRTYPERVALTYYKLSEHCNYFTFTGTTFVPNTAKTGCTNFAVAGGRINGAGAGLTGSHPQIIENQLIASVAAGNHTANDLLLIDGGGNDAADLVSAYLGATTPTGLANYVTFLKSLGAAYLPAATVDAAVATGAAGVASIGTQYMTALASKFYDQIKAQALDKGATRVAIVNAPNITLTPRLQRVLAGVAVAAGGGATGAAAAQQAGALFTSWVQAFNAELVRKSAGNKNVAIADLYSTLNTLVADPKNYALENTSTPTCPVTGTEAGTGLPSYTLSSCTAEYLADHQPVGVTNNPSWFNHYLFSDDFHPTPTGHSWGARAICKTLFDQAWIASCPG